MTHGTFAVMTLHQHTRKHLSEIYNHVRYISYVSMWDMVPSHMSMWDMVPSHVRYISHI